MTRHVSELDTYLVLQLGLAIGGDVHLPHRAIDAGFFMRQVFLDDFPLTRNRLDDFYGYRFFFSVIQFDAVGRFKFVIYYEIGRASCRERV